MNAYRTVSAVSVQEHCSRLWGRSMVSASLSIAGTGVMDWNHEFKLALMLACLAAMFCGMAVMASIINRRFGE